MFNRFHSEGNHQPLSPARVLGIGITLLLGFAIFEAISGWMSHSLALLSDSGHMAADALSLVLAAIAGWVANKPPSKKHSYGLGRAEVLGAWISSLFMVIVAIVIAIEAIHRFTAPASVHSHTVILVSGAGIILNLILARLLSHAKPNLNLRAALLHVLGDLLGSLSALISGIVIYMTGWLLIDPILSIFIALLILFSSLNLLKETLTVLMEGVPLHLDITEVKETMCKIQGVLDIHDLHIWTLSSGSVALTAHIELDTMQYWESTLKELHRLLSHNFKITHVTLQPENLSLLPL